MKKYIPLIIAGVGILAAIIIIVFRSSPAQAPSHSETNTNTTVSERAVRCETAGGTWIESALECEGVSPGWCAEERGYFNNCASACRNNPDAEICTKQCVLVCEFGESVIESDLISVNEPEPGDGITSPLTISGEAKGPWYFEATFPIVLVDWDGLIIAESYATADGDWMTEDFVPFTATLEFDAPATPYPSGTLILKKANPSGMPEFDDAIEIPIFFE